MIIPPKELISILNYEDCDANIPDFDSFCSLVDAEESEVCTAFLGSPVMCGEVFAGFLTNNGTCSANDDSMFLSFLSVGEFGSWIQEVTKPNLTKKDEKFILSIAHYDVLDIETAVVQCVGSVITEKHIVTTASCVNVPPSKGIIVQQKLTNENETDVISALPIIVSIHPDYIESDGNSSNIAVILVKKLLELDFNNLE